MADSLLNNIVLIQAYGFRRESVAVLVAAPYLLEYFGRSEYVPCTEARAGSLFFEGWVFEPWSVHPFCSLLYFVFRLGY